MSEQVWRRGTGRGTWAVIERDGHGHGFRVYEVTDGMWELRSAHDTKKQAKDAARALCGHVRVR